MIKTLREERARLMKRLVHSEDLSVKPRIRELTEEILNQLRQGTQSGRFSAANPATSNYPRDNK